ncbi:unnamed protein product [Durusdinium trenchii]|uniref:Uncharacterized protein n=1 Tax=Durusdinium trenchii TaxID=1381693 RepID=A0ABP0MND6_9DINO
MGFFYGIVASNIAHPLDSVNLDVTENLPPKQELRVRFCGQTIYLLKAGQPGVYAKFIKEKETEHFSVVPQFVAAYTCKSLGFTALVTGTRLAVGLKVVTCELVDERVIFTAALESEEVANYTYKPNTTWWDLMVCLQEDTLGGFLGKSMQIRIVVGVQPVTEKDWNDPVKNLLGKADQVPNRKAPSSSKASAPTTKEKQSAKTPKKSLVMKRPARK